MKHALTLILLLFAYVKSNAQTTTTYYDQNGWPVVTAKTEKTWAPQPFQGSPYQSSLPSLDLIERGLAKKQGETDSRKAAIQAMIDGAAADINRMFATYPIEGKELFNGLKDLITRLNNVQQDITQDRVYTPIVDEVNNFKSKIYSTYRRVNVGVSGNASSFNILSLLEYKKGNAPSFLGMTKDKIEEILRNNSIQVERDKNNEGTAFLSYSVSEDIEITYYFNQSTCTKYLLVLPAKYKYDITMFLNRLYTPIVDDGKSGNLTYDGIWVDRDHNMRWTLEITSDQLLIREKQNLQ